MLKQSDDWSLAIAKMIDQTNKINKLQKINSEAYDAFFEQEFIVNSKSKLWHVNKNINL